MAAALMTAACMGCTLRQRPWISGARAKHASLQSTSDVMALFAAVAAADAAPDTEAQWSYRDLTLEQGAASVWSALDDHYEPTFISFTDEAYAAMRDDESRTPYFAQAIEARLACAPSGTLAVLDIGTGPHAVLALLAARAGARKVYAVEVNPEAAKRARETVAAAGFGEVVEVIEGFSTAVELPELVDVVVSEIVGSIASEEGLYASIRDAHARFVKDPQATSSWIPYRVETWGAPCSWALQYALGPPRYDWSRNDEPLRLSCLDASLLALAPPQRLEDIDFTRNDLPPSSCEPSGPPAVDATFEVSAATLERNTRCYEKHLLAAGVEASAAARHAHNAAHGLSGLALWPRLLLREGEPSGAGQPAEPPIVVETRGRGSGGPSAAPGASAWQTVLSILEERPVTVQSGTLVHTRLAVELPSTVDDPVWYTAEYT